MNLPIADTSCDQSPAQDGDMLEKTTTADVLGCVLGHYLPPFSGLDHEPEDWRTGW
jgi:hypothetical protein